MFFLCYIVVDLLLKRNVYFKEGSNIGEQWGHLVITFVLFDTPEPVDRVNCILGLKLAGFDQLVDGHPNKTVIS